MAELREVLASPRNGYCYCLHLHFWGGRQSIFFCTKDNYILLGKGMKFVTVQICIETCVNVEQEKR